MEVRGNHCLEVHRTVAGRHQRNHRAAEQNKIIFIIIIIINARNRD